MYSVTLEWNAVITWESPDRPQRKSLKQIVAMHGKTIDVGIVTTAASENTKERELPASATAFSARLAEIGWDDLTFVYTLGVGGLTYYDWSIWAGSGDNETVSAIWGVIAPKSIPESSEEFRTRNGISKDLPLAAPEFQKWRNVWCDVHSIFAHIRSGRDLFISGDVKNFKNEKKSRLQELGLNEICSYDDALEIIPKA